MNHYRFINNLHSKLIDRIEKDKVVLTIPENLTSGHVRSLMPSSFDDATMWKEMVYYMVSQIYKETVLDDKSVAYLHSDFLKKNFGNLYPKIINGLLDAKIITLKHNFKRGISPNGYKLSNAYSEAKPRHAELSHKKVVDRFRGQLKNIASEQKKYLLKHKELVACLFDEKLRLDESHSKAYVKRLQILFKNHINKVQFKSEREKEQALEMLKWKISYAKSIIEGFNDFSNLNAQIPKFQIRGERMHTKISLMLSELRNFLQYNGKSNLVYFDISNSQPFHMLAVMKPEFWSKTKQSRKVITLKNMDEHLYKTLSRREEEEYNAILRSLKPVPIDISKPMLSRRTGPNDGVKKFYHLIVTGKLYKFISDEFKDKLGLEDSKNPLLTRDSAKQFFIKTLYSDKNNVHSLSSKFMKVFSEDFPVVVNVINFIKSDSKRDFAYLLQRIESEFIINRIASPLSKSNPNIPLYTIHDGIITTEEFADLLHETFQKVYISEFGLAPNITRSILKPENAMNKSVKYSEKKVQKMLNEKFGITENMGMSLTDISFYMDALNYNQNDHLPEGFDYIDYSFLFN
jgi:hypothetical protein